MAKRAGSRGYLGQAMRHAGVYRVLAKMGYLDYQFPCWIKRPEYPVAMPMQPQAVPVETRPPGYTLTHEPATSRPQDFSNDETKRSDYLEKWWKKNPMNLNDLDVSKLPPDSYTMRILHNCEYEDEP